MWYLFEHVGIPTAYANSSIKSLQDYSRPLSSSRPKKEWPHTALHCYNESEKQTFLYEKINCGLFVD